jgi:fatty-acyl-CoA synthase
MDAHFNSTCLTTSQAKGSTSVPLVDESIGEALSRSARRWPDRTALVNGSADAAARSRWTYQQLHHQALRSAWALLSSFKLGDALAVWAPNCPEWVFLEFGAALAGLKLVTVNPAYLAPELLHVLRQSGAKGLIYVPDYRGRDLSSIVREVRAELPELHTALALPAWVELVGAARPVALPAVGSTDIAQIQYTSGTTGFPKGAELTHRGLANNGRLYALAIGATRADVWVNPMPMFHTAGCGLVTLGCLQTGGTHVLPREFDPALMLELLEAERGTIVLSVPTMMLRMLDHPSLASRDLSSWRLATLGGAPVAPELVRRAREALGVTVAIGFGQTESSPYITHTEPNDAHPEWWLTVGKPLPQVELKVVDPETGEVVPIGVVGEVCTRSVCVMRGYHRNPEATKAAITPDGWLRTGDLGAMDEHGYLRIQGRLKDMIIRGGENVYPREVEDLLFTHPAVANVAVVGIPDTDWGEVVAAFVQLKTPGQADAQELETFCRTTLASYKVPRLWRFVDAFPQTASGKIQKFALRAQLERTPHA